MDGVTFFVPGIPVAQPRQRSRVMHVGGKVMAMNYTPADSPVNAFKAAVRMAWPKDTPATDGPVHIVAAFLFPRPKSKTKKSRNFREWKAGKPDIDNLFKSLADALTGLAWKDDSQVAMATLTKRIAGDGDIAGVTVSIGSL